MKSLLFIVLVCIFPVCIYAQNQQKDPVQDARNHLASMSIPLNHVQPKPGFTLYYNCDSLLFMRGDFGDTIKIWTPAMEWGHTLDEFKDIVKDSSFGKTVFPKYIHPDGRIFVATYSETQFIYRNDSLFQIEDTVSLPKEYFEVMVQEVQGLIADTTAKRIKDSIGEMYKDRHAYLPKLIYAKYMFRNGKKKVKLSNRVNYERDEIVLENEWVEDSKKCFVIRINNREDGEKTSYAYALNEDMRFVWWEGCKNRPK
jgi:hypothetical protein